MKIITPLILITLSSIFVAIFYSLFNDGYDIEWTMVNENYSVQQADAHVIRTKDGRVILIDAGHVSTSRKALLPFLKQQSIKSIETIFISHPHKDHYGGLYTLLDSDIQIREVFFNIPDKSVCDREVPWGCDYNDILSLHSKLKANNVAIKVATAGQRYSLGSNSWLDILYAFDGINTPVGRTDVNDLSLIMMLHCNQYKLLFTGDLNRKIGAYLADNADNIDAQVLKVPHHGTEGLAPNKFFEKVGPEFALVPAPKHLWLSERSKRVRKWFYDNNVSTYINGLHGNIKVHINDKKLTIIPENNKESISAK